MQKINFVVRNYDFFKIKTVKDEHIRLLILKVDGSRSCLLGKLPSCARRRQLKKKCFKKGNMVNQYMRVRLEEIEEQAETINISILFRYD